MLTTKIPKYRDPQHQGLTVWLTGLSGAGKSTIAHGLYTELLARGLRSELLDADVVRDKLSRNLGFSREDRNENVRKIGFVARMLTKHGVIVVVAAISPDRALREEVRDSIGAFLEIHVDAPVSVCEKRDPKGLYKKARAGQILNFTGIDVPYEAPLTPNVRCNTHLETPEQSIFKVVEAVLEALE